MSNYKLLGGVLLIVGTSIGAGMLALPIALATAGIVPSIIFLILCWLVMTAGAFLILEVNLRMPAGSNIASMAKATLGVPGQLIAWISYLFLLYTLLAAYISGGGDVFQDFLRRFHIITPDWLAAILFTLSFSLIVYSGIRIVDYANRGLMFGKLGLYLLLLAIITPHMDSTNLAGGSFPAILGGLMLLITSFGFATIVPSLRDYFDSDLASLRKVILLGSGIPLLCYVLWNTTIMGALPKAGNHGLVALVTSSHATSGLTEALNQTLKNQWITGFFGFFTSICMVTAFLGVSLGLFDFLVDGLKLKKYGRQGKYVLGLTFLPPLIIVLLEPGIYLHALNYAGFLCVILLLLLPVAMAWQNRKQVSNNTNNSITVTLVPGGYITLTLLLFIGVFLLGLELVRVLNS